MPVPLVAGLGLASFAGRLGVGQLTRRTIGIGARTGGQSLIFGGGYSLGTYLGFPGNYQSRGGSNTVKSYGVIDTSMPFGRGYGYGGRSRYGSRYGRRRYSRYGRRSYYGRRRFY